MKYIEKRLTSIIQGIPNILAYCGKNSSQKYKFCVLSNDLIGRSFSLTGNYEEYGIEAVKYLCENQYIPNSFDSTFVDIGANIGTYSIQLSSQFKTVLAFEPHPIVNRVLDLNKTINNIENLSIQQYGLSNINTQSKLYEPILNVGGSSLEHQSSAKYYQVEIKHASKAINQLKASKVSFIKIDVEGHELMVMKGLKELILKDQPIIAFEANDPERNPQLLKFMQDVGYTKFLALDTKPSIKHPILRLLVLATIGARYHFKPITNLDNQKYSLVFAFITDNE